MYSALQYEYKSVSPMGALTVREGELVTGVLHTAAEMMRPSSGYRIFDKAMISSPTSTALDIQSWGMDLASLKHMAMQQQRWAEAAGFVFVDSLGFSLPLAWSSEDSDGAYIDNVHFAGELLWGYAEWKLNIFARVASQT